jgi:hypothetical protein
VEVLVSRIGDFVVDCARTLLGIQKARRNSGESRCDQMKRAAQNQMVELIPVQSS